MDIGTALMLDLSYVYIIMKPEKYAELIITFISYLCCTIYAVLDSIIWRSNHGNKQGQDNVFKSRIQRDRTKGK